MRSARNTGAVLLAGMLGCGGLGCGGKAASEGANEPPPAPAAPAPTPSPPAPEPARPTAAPSPPASAEPSPPVVTPSEEYTEYELRQAQVQNILLAYCGACHGPPLSPEEALGGIWFINDLDELTEQGYIVPLISAQSRIVQVMRDGSMPPPSSGWGPVPDVEIDVVAEFIDAPLFWPVQQPRPSPGAGMAPVDAGADGG